ncbi:MAG TPA: hypothetical protein VNS22_20210 [Geminicoccus sp.]|uniref:hypothetical protein n=1 Tax=Geminicoccus sp. TaxID=2024832 RepID=UPI002CD44E71|nr:hypothetical protein [Geminicoccus sp.]HWL70681.1 hypothetical protein [Geminicoccus sp.]
MARTVGHAIDVKLSLTAAALGAITRKDLALAFRRVNPSTSFDLERAHKWLQGRSKPREMALYEDWSRLLGLARPGAWIAECSVEAFLDAVCARSDADRATMLRRADAFRGTSQRDRPEGVQELLGEYACYSHAWSPYFAGRLIRGCLSITLPASGSQPRAAYVEVLPHGQLLTEGTVTLAPHALQLDLRDPQGGAQLLHVLFAPSPPVSVLGGLMCGTTILGPERVPSVTRILMVRLPDASPGPAIPEAYLPAEASVAADLEGLGLVLDDPDEADRRMRQFLTGTLRPGIDQIMSADFRAVVELLDQAWIMRNGRGSGV